MLLTRVLLIFISVTMLPYRLLKTELQRQNCFKEYLDYGKSLEKLDNCALRISFLEKCRNSDIIPKFLNFRVPNNGCFVDSSVKDFQRRLLHREIGKAKTTLNECIARVDEKRSSLKARLPGKCISSVVFHSKRDRRVNKQTVSAKHEKKLINLSLDQEKPLFNVSNTVQFCDVSVNIPDYVKQTLAMGPRNPIMDTFDEKEVLVELDCFLKYCSKLPIPDATLTDINIKTLSYIKTCKKQKPPRHIKMTQKFLKENDLRAVPFDKGIGFCVMDNQTYEKKLDPIIDLPQFEQHVDSRKNAKNAIIKEEERIVNVLTQLKRDGKISESLFEELKPVGSQPPRLYGLAKVHKKDTPLRPIVSMPGSAYYKVAKKLLTGYRLCHSVESTLQLRRCPDN